MFLLTEIRGVPPVPRTDGHDYIPNGEVREGRSYGGRFDDAAAEDGVAVVEDGGLARRDGRDGLGEIDAAAPALERTSVAGTGRPPERTLSRTSAGAAKVSNGPQTQSRTVAERRKVLLSGPTTSLFPGASMPMT